MNLRELKAHGAFVAAQPVKKNVSWKTPAGEDVNFDIFVKRLSFGVVEKVFLKDSDDLSRSANFISQSVMLTGDNGKPVPISYDDAYSLEPSLARVFLDATNEVNSTGNNEPKN